MDAPFFICSCLATIESRTWNRVKKKTAYLTTNGSVKTNYLKTNLLKQIKKILVLNEYPLITHCFICIYGTSLWMPNISIS